MTNGYLVPSRDAFSQGFLTKVASGTTTSGAEEYLYAVEITPVPTSYNGPRMAPILDDVQVVYLTESGAVLEEVEVVD